ncbi:MAG: type IX secretion system sortase PorU, partial [Saprospiraceae bacterium]|nr:type IX secretion system sortase PorU [Saprospiraceae bacterium]
GSNGWAQERVLQHEDIDKWKNQNKLPLLITATCSFAGYDNPRKISAGEFSLTNPQGGSIALFTTVRAVYANSNERLTASVFDHLFRPVNGRVPPIGQILINSKNSNSADTLGSNARKFTLLGDPAMHLAIPQYNIETLTINGKDVGAAASDTLKALSKVTVTGEIVDNSGQLASTFNGKIYPTIYDKTLTLKTLAQDQGSFERSFGLQKSVIFKGLASVNGGRFSFTFVIPKDINYVFGQGKISYYAEDGSPVDAKGQYSEIVVGGTNDEGLDDSDGPDIDLFLDDDQFVFGGITDKNPVLLIHLTDENGINVIGNSIGHDLTGILDKDIQNTLIFNDFYEAAQDDHTSGVVTYPLNNLALGSHTIEVKAWDIANNSSTMFTEFVVVDEAAAALQHVLNYPNPFSTSTCFQFEHAFPNQDLDIRVDIFTVSGRLINTIRKSIKSSTTLSRDLKWDGRDQFGDPLANGIYIYRLKVRTSDGSGRQFSNESELQKLVILR